MVLVHEYHISHLLFYARRGKDTRSNPIFSQEIVEYVAGVAAKEIVSINKNLEDTTNNGTDKIHFNSYSAK